MDIQLIDNDNVTKTDARYEATNILISFHQLPIPNSHDHSYSTISIIELDYLGHKGQRFNKADKRTRWPYRNFSGDTIISNRNRECKYFICMYIDREQLQSLQ